MQRVVDAHSLPLALPLAHQIQTSSPIQRHVRRNGERTIFHCGAEGVSSHYVKMESGRVRSRIVCGRLRKLASLWMPSPGVNLLGKGFHRAAKGQRCPRQELPIIQKALALNTPNALRGPSTTDHILSHRNDVHDPAPRP
jgi:hypothetical protein